MLKFNLFLLPFLSMQDDGEGGEEKKPSRTEQFLNALGLAEEVKGIISDSEKPIDEAVTKFKSMYSGVLRDTHLKTWEEDKRAALIKETQTGSHVAFQNKLLKTFELDPENFKDKEKKTEAIIQAAKEMYSGKITELKTKLESGSDATQKQLQEQLDLRNREFEEMTKEFTELRKLKEELPKIKEQIIEAERDRLWLSERVAVESEKIKNKSAAASLKVIQLLINDIAKIEVVRDEKGNRKEVIKDLKTDAPFMRTPTDNYRDIGTFIKEQVLIPNKLINLQNVPAGNGNLNGNGEGPPKRVDDGKKRVIHPNADI